MRRALQGSRAHFTTMALKTLYRSRHDSFQEINPNPPRPTVTRANGCCLNYSARQTIKYGLASGQNLAEQLHKLGVHRSRFERISNRRYCQAKRRASKACDYIGPALHHDERVGFAASIDAARAKGRREHFVNFNSVLHAIASDLRSTRNQARH